ncbi:MULTISPECIES: hypothetical protein [Streptomyces]|uniref:hypothetical protein n=1 Tax=Streptomyces TaxID=1883 RepID=UPI000F73989E|nr:MULTISPECIES: hypothetical protein [Streptomyces]MCM3263354.1 hypothetical protein [Streptomyces thermoviolaceus]RSR98958.1 hypothetical protein EF917_19950 [Streptomyces sp. WAC00469]
MNGDWLLRGRDGRLHVYFLSGDAVLCRAERWPGGPWDAPRRMGGDQRVHPVLALGQGSDRYTHLVSWRPTVPGESGLVHSTHFRPLLAALDWMPVGHPNNKGDRTGTPAVAVDAEGRAHLFVRNAGGGVSMRAQRTKGGWSPWWDLRGQGTHRDGLAAVTAESGTVELYAAVRGGVQHWRQEEPGGRLVPGEKIGVEPQPGSLYALATSPGATTLFYVDSVGDLCAWRPGGKPVTVLGAAGTGPVTAVRCVLDGHDCTVFAQCSDSGRVAFAACPTEEESAGAWWTESGPQLPPDARVCLTTDADGRLVAAVSSPATGRLLVTRRKDEPGLALQAWREV